MNPISHLNMAFINWPLVWQHAGVTLVLACAIAWLWRRWSLVRQATKTVNTDNTHLARLDWWRMTWMLFSSALLSCIPLAGLSLTAWFTPLLGQLCVLSILLLMGLLWQLVHHRSRTTSPLLPTRAWGWIALLGGLCIVDMLALWPWDLYASGYLGQPIGLTWLRQSLPLLWWFGLIILARPAAWLLLPWIIWAFGVLPSPNVWDVWIDLPLTLTAMLIVGREVFRRVRSLSKVQKDTSPITTSIS